MRIVCVSDTHNRQGDFEVPDGDLLLHAGDSTMQGTPEELFAFNEWLGSLPHPDKIVTAGNHDFLFEREPRRARALLTNAVYLEDSGLTVKGLRIWGSPWQPWFFDWAFNLRRGAALKAKWDLIPEGTDILITHGPPRGIGDRVAKMLGRAAGLALGQGAHAGCDDLLSAVRRIAPRIHLFGHIHEGYGQVVEGGIRFVNASICDQQYRPIQRPIVLELDEEQRGT